MQGLYASGQLFEVETLSQCVIDEYNPNIQNVDFFILAARTEIELTGFSPKADQFIRQAMKLAPNNDVALAYFKMSMACLDLKDGLYESGEATLTEALDRHELRAYAQFFLGHHLFWKKNDLVQATEHLEACVLEKPYFLAAWTDLALLYKRTGERLKANHAWQKCLSIDRDASRRDFYQKHLERF